MVTERETQPEGLVPLEEIPVHGTGIPEGLLEGGEVVVVRVATEAVPQPLPKPPLDDVVGNPSLRSGFRIADTVGFEYEYIESRQEFAHAAAVFVLTPDGRVSRYLFGVAFDPRTLRLSLVEASEGGVGSVFDQFLLYCFAYDAEAGQYTPVAWRIMRVGGVATALVLGVSLVGFWIKENRQKRAA